MYLQNLIRTKGQVISKGKFGVFNSSKKRTKNINFCPSLLEQNFCIHFLEELKTQQSFFEIN